MRISYSQASWPKDALELGRAGVETRTKLAIRLDWDQRKLHSFSGSKTSCARLCGSRGKYGAAWPLVFGAIACLPIAELLRISAIFQKAKSTRSMSSSLPKVSQLSLHRLILTGDDPDQGARMA